MLKHSFTFQHNTKYTHTPCELTTPLRHEHTHNTNPKLWLKNGKTTDDHFTERLPVVTRSCFYCERTEIIGERKVRTHVGHAGRDLSDAWRS